MKKVFLVIVFSLIAAISAIAVPTGLYGDDRGRNRVVVETAGKEIYFIDSEGNVTKTLQVIKENQDGSFTTKDLSTGIVRSDNSFWYENGVCYLNLAQKRVTLKRIK